MILNSLFIYLWYVGRNFFLPIAMTKLMFSAFISKVQNA